MDGDYSGIYFMFPLACPIPSIYTQSEKHMAKTKINFACHVIIKRAYTISVDYANIAKLIK